MHERMLRVLGGTLVAVMLALSSAGADAQEVTAQVNADTDTQILDVADSSLAERVPSPAIQLVPPGMSNLRVLPAGTKIRRVTVGGSTLDGSVAAVVDEKLIYSNTRGRVVISFPAGFLVADDIATIAPDECQLTRFSFQVMGNADARSDETRSYTVTHALYDTCPEAFPDNASPPRLIEGTLGTKTVSTDVGDVVEFTIDVSQFGVRSKTSMWLAITFNRDNCAVIGGTPPLEGFSGDMISFPALGCNPALGNFPRAPHASFNTEIFGDSLSCPTRHIQYRNTREEGIALAPGTDQVFVDDLTLLTDSGACLLTGYEVAVLGRAVYHMELRLGCAGDPPSLDWSPNGTSARIDGTYKRTSIGSASKGTRIVRIAVDPPIPLPPTVFLAVKVTNPTGGPILTGTQAKIGNTGTTLEKMNLDGSCGPANLPPSSQGALQVTLICEGPARPGACCDMFTKQCDGGADDGDPCGSDSQCEDPGLCNAPCLEVPRVNCSFPERGGLQLPAWVPDGVCDGEEDPFADQFNFDVKACGASACCFEDSDSIERCRNLFERDCDVVGNQEKPRQWQRGRLCDQINQFCPLIACLQRAGDCKEDNSFPTGPICDGPAGCNDSTCCSAVCRTDFDDFCCRCVWDHICADIAIALPQCQGSPRNDKCTGAVSVEGIGETSIIVAGDTKFAVESEDDPIVCCHNGFPNECDGGPRPGDVCEQGTDCEAGNCGPAEPIGRHSVWYKFIAEDTSVSVDTCLSTRPAIDSMLAVFKAGDSGGDEVACQTLGLIGCNDDGCAGVAGAFFEENSKLCVRNLVIGDLYYVMLSTKKRAFGPDTLSPAGNYDVRFESPCPDERPLANDFCDFAEPVTDTDCGTCDPVTTDLTDATLQCPAPLNTPGMLSDQWFEYTATCTGLVTVDTCGSGFDTSLVIYAGCDTCPNFETPPIAFNDNATSTDFFPDCAIGSQQSLVTFDAIAGECFRVRVGDQSGAGTTGLLNISCSPICPRGEINWIDPPLNTVDAGRPWLLSDPTHAQLGIETIIVEIIPNGVQPGATPTNISCWDICENNALNGVPVGIQSIVALPSNQFEMTLTRPLTAHAATTIEYLGNAATRDFSRIITHPGNVDGGISADARDIFFAGETNNLVIRLRLLLDPDFNPPFPPLQGEPHSLDIDRSGIFGPLDLLDLVDLMNGAEEYPAEFGTAIPSSSLCPNN